MQQSHSTATAIAVSTVRSLRRQRVLRLTHQRQRGIIERCRGGDVGQSPEMGFQCVPIRPRMRPAAGCPMDLLHLSGMFTDRCLVRRRRQGQRDLTAVRCQGCCGEAKRQWQVRWLRAFKVHQSSAETECLPPLLPSTGIQSYDGPMVARVPVPFHYMGA